jgi:hypothetical protein
MARFAASPRAIQSFAGIFWAQFLLVATILLTSGSPAAFAQSMEVTPTPSSTSFGSVPLGTTNTQSVQLKNTGTQTLSVWSLAVYGTGFKISGLSWPFTIAAGQSVHFSAEFTPTYAGSFSGYVGISSNAADSWLKVPLSGSGSASSRALSVNPGSLSFGAVTIGVYKTENATVTNTGNSSVIISAVNVSSGLSATGISVGTTISAGQSATLVTEYAPKITGSYSGSITITSNASTITIPVTGTGAAASGHLVDLSWGTASGASGYNVYRSTTNGSGYSKLVTDVSGTTYTDQNVVAGVQYYYVVTSLSSSGQESSYSNQTSALIP